VILKELGNNQKKTIVLISIDGGTHDGFALATVLSSLWILSKTVEKHMIRAAGIAHHPDRTAFRPQRQQPEPIERFFIVYFLPFEE